MDAKNFSKLKELIDELSLTTVLLDEDDPSSLEPIIASCQSLQHLTQHHNSQQRLYAACLAFLTASKSHDAKALFDQAKAFVTAAQDYIIDPSSAVFPNEHNTSTDKHIAWGDDLAKDYDEDLLLDFIAQYDQSLDEFEADLLANAYKPKAASDSSDFNSSVRRYLHTLKGDSGTVGLIGISRATHILEDILSSHNVQDIVEQILSYKSWVLSCLRAWSQSVAPVETSDTFIDRLLSSCATPTKATSSCSEDKPSSDSMECSSQNNPVTYRIEGDQEILAEFTQEADDHFNTVEEVLLEESDSIDADSVDTIFRSIHSVKGGAAFFNLQDITETSHVTETVLDRVRQGELTLDRALRNVMLAYIDLQKQLFSEARQAMARDGVLVRAERAAKYLKEITRFTKEGEQHAAQSAAPTVVQPSTTNGAHPPKQASSFEPLEDDAAQGFDQMSTEDSASKKGGKVDIKTFVKVDTTRLDKLIEYIGEMMISSSMLIRQSRDLLGSNEAVTKNAHQFELISRELQSIGMSMRLIPIKGTLQKMSRLVWDTSKKIGKEVSFEMEGEDTELDRAIIDKLADPLMHMVRNSVDHGVEPPDVRESKGKPRKGVVKISAFHLGGNIHIQIRDDGKGLDPKVLLNKAIEKGIVSPNDNLSIADIYQLIFAPGFSTAEKITDVSGRGVGMDVVKRNIESLRGRVEVESTLGVGSTFTIQLPLTLAIVDGIETRVGREKFIIPTVSLVEFLKPTSEMIVRPFNSDETLQFRGKFIPILRLSELYQVKGANRNALNGILAIVSMAGKEVALMLDEVIGTYSTVIKSLGEMFSGAKGLAGCAIMPDGNIGLILDVGTLVDLAHSVKQAHNYRLTPQEEVSLGL
ncbi:MAG: Hpt domain-containing protein [Deltaproteobacteria bacterium]|nr:Hpt domain-containing protein [Deltaproteobacteria bacterium]